MKSITNIRHEIYTNNVYDITNILINGDEDTILSGKYFGEVVDNNDPIKKGRIKVRVYGIFTDNIPTPDIPWAIPDLSYNGSTKGAFIVPPTGTKVRVYFDKDDIYCPVYEAKGYYQDDLPDGIDTNYPDTMILYSTDQGEYYSVNRATKETKLNVAGKIAIGNSSVEVLDILSNLIDLVNTSIVPTSLGPQQLSNAVGGTTSPIGTLKTRLDTIKGAI